MTDDLIKRLRINAPYEAPRCLEAADRIEALEAENERLREVVAVYYDQSNQFGKVFENYINARAALETKP